jgi:uncharacterized protein
MCSEKRKNISFRRLPEKFVICQMHADAEIPSWATVASFTSITRTGHELSIVCPLTAVPQEVKIDKGWIGFMLAGPFSLTQTGILHSFLDPLARAGIPIFAISTYDTDYVFVPEDTVERGIETLEAAGHSRIA